MDYYPLKSIARINDCVSIPQLRYCFNLNKWIAENNESYQVLIKKINYIRDRGEYPDELIEDLLMDIEIYREQKNISIEDKSKPAFCLSCGASIKNQGRRTKKFCNHKCYYIYLRKKFN